MEDYRGIKEISRINGDVLTLIKITKEIGWERINILSITRILYLSSVLYTFKYPQEHNPFSDDYHFIVSLRGPYSGNIQISIKFLLANKFIEEIKKNSGVFVLGRNPIPDLTDIPYIAVKKDWFKVIIYILGIYGEEKIYDFVFRDPEYQDNIQRNAVKNELEIGPNNKTNEILERFKNSFEINLKDQNIELDDKQYLELYFEYLFSKILKGET